MNRTPYRQPEDPSELEADYAALLARLDAGADVPFAEMSAMTERLHRSAEDHQRIADGLRAECRERYGVTPI